MLKRLLILAVALILFVTAFLIYFRVNDAGIEHDFRAEREKFHVEGLELTTATPPTPIAVTGVSQIPTAPAAIPDDITPEAPGSLRTPDGSASTPGASSATPASALLDSNALIGLPPETNGPAPSPVDSSAPATNAAPAPSSTFIYPGLRQLPLVMMASLSVSGPQLQAPAGTSSVPAVPSSPSPAAMTNSPAPAAPGVPPPPAPRAAMHAGAVASSVIVLGYHQFTGPGIPSKNIYSMRQDVFEGEMKYLKDNGYHVVPLSDVVRFAKGEIGLPPDSVAVTIDDGYKSSIVWAAPVLKKYGFPWTYFVYPAFITVHEGKGAASWGDLTELQNEGVDIECHSMTHPILPSHRQKWKSPVPHTLTPEEYDAFLTDETITAKTILEQHLGKKVNFFAYPYGEYNKAVEDKVIAAGFTAIFTVANNPIHSGTNIDAMGRYIITLPVEKAFASYLRQGALGLADISPPPGSTVSDPRPIVSAVLGYNGTINPESITTEVRDMGEVRHDFDPKSSTLRLYLPRDLIAPAVIINIHAKDSTSGQNLTASWRFNYQPTAPGLAHAPIGAAPAAGAAPAVQPAAPAPAAQSMSNAAPAPSPVAGSNGTPAEARTTARTIASPASNAAPPAPTTP